MEINKLKNTILCPNCNKFFDTLEHLPKILPQCNHTLCYNCIKNIFLENCSKKIICPIDKTEYNDITNINSFPDDKKCLKNLNNYLNLVNSEISKIDNNSEGIINDETYINKFSSLTKINEYYKKINDLKKFLKIYNKKISCNLHCLPLNIICIDERKKICSQCALNDIHSKHQIITEEDFIINLEKLINLLQEIDNNQIKYLLINNSINIKKTIDEIDFNIKQLIDLVNDSKEKIIKNINRQCEKIINFLNKRKNEIKKKFKNNNFDMKNLRESALNWMKLVNDKLNKINEVNENNFDLIKLIDTKQEKNISNLISSGKQLRNRFIFSEESIKIINNLEEFKKNGIKLEPNLKIINNIFDFKNNDSDINYLKNSQNSSEKIIENNQIKNDNKEETYKEIKDEIKITLFNVEENYNLINLLHLEFSEFDIKEKPRIDKNIKEKLDNKVSDKKTTINFDEINIDEDILLISPNTNINKNSNNNNIQNGNLNNENNSFFNKIKDSNEEVKEFQIKKEINNIKSNINVKKSNYIITKKIRGININKSNYSLISNMNNCQNNKENKDINTIKDIYFKEKYIKPLYKMNSEEKLFTSYSRSPPNRRLNIKYSSFLHLEDKTNERGRIIDQSINLHKMNNSKKQRGKRIKVGLNNKLSNYLNKNKEKRNSSHLSVKKNNLSINKIKKELTKRNSKEILKNESITSYNKKNLKINSYKFQRNHPSKKSFSLLYSDQMILDSNNKTISDNKNEENSDNNIKIDIHNHYSSICTNENINNNNNNENNNNIKPILKKNIINTNKYESFETKPKKELQNIILTQMKSLSPNFSRINMNNIGIQLICSYLHKNPNKIYKEMKLLGCNLVDDDLFLLIRTLLDHNINLLILNLSNNKITDESASNILDLLKDHQSLKALSLYNNLISDLLKEKLKEYTLLGRENLDSIQLYI